MKPTRDVSPYLIVAAVVVIAGIVMANAALATLGFGLAIVCGGARLWAHYSLRRLTYERIMPEDHAFAGERVAVTLRLTNRKPLPLPWIEAHETFPAGLLGEQRMTDTGAEFQQTGQAGIFGLDWRTSAGGYERVSRTVALQCGERGVYNIGPASLRSGDAFGIFEDGRMEERTTRVVVYPRTVELPDLRLPSRRPYGESAGGLRVFEDPSRVAGIRDYRPEDSLRRIDWNATARAGKLMSRVYDPTSSQHLLVCLNTQTVTPAWAGYIPDVLERMIVIAASIAREAYEQRYAVGLLANSTMPEPNQSWRQHGDALFEAARASDLRGRRWPLRRAAASPDAPRRAARSIRIAPGRRPEQLIRMLEALAVISPFVIEPLAASLEREEHRLALGTTLAIVTGTMPADLVATLVRLQRRGHQIVVLSATGEAWPGDLGDIPVRDLSQIATGFGRASSDEGRAGARGGAEPNAAPGSEWARPSP